ncbi:hypothetical protein L5G32_15545 [Gordonia sp. HY002]|uniref:hypothetical protein n=1 Tax=Gordonia zhenghanii TaxID=2911516 RepID=UPI001EF03E01|nr:hypothetical protein [Gordonia zhenghanii]MCF8571685.1 hypothetical protein [Gordonia zhenghanii]MCF8602708.1 hypothetical protein [Gordonia zhenghanii]
MTDGRVAPADDTAIDAAKGDGAQGDPVVVRDDGRSDTGPSRVKPSKKDRLRRDLEIERRRAGRWRRFTIAVAALAAVLLIAVCGLTWSTVAATGDLDGLRTSTQENQERLSQARASAERYAEKTLMISSQNAKEYVTSLAEGTTEEFGKTFGLGEGEAGGLTLELISQLKMQSEGDIAYSMFAGDRESLPAEGAPWNFVVVATQTVTTIQQPEPSTSAVILRVIVVHRDGKWLVTSFAPDPKIQAGNAGGVPGIK